MALVRILLVRMARSRLVVMLGGRVFGCAGTRFVEAAVVMVIGGIKVAGMRGRWGVGSVVAAARGTRGGLQGLEALLHALLKKKSQRAAGLVGRRQGRRGFTFNSTV